MNALTIVALLLLAAACMVIWRLLSLLRGTMQELEEARERSQLDLRRHHESLSRALDSIRAFVTDSAASLESKSEELRSLIQQAERIAQAPRATPSAPPASTTPRPEPATTGNASRQAILDRLERGETVEQVARGLGLSQREVDLVARLRPKG